MRENTQHYIRVLDGLLMQDMQLDIVVSACMSSEETKAILKDRYTNQVMFNFIDEVLPVNVTFNHTVIEAVKRRGEYDGYLYLDSGIHFDNKPSIIKALYNAYKSDNFGMMVGRTDTDSGYDRLFGVWPDERLFQNGEIFVLPVGKAVNLHWQIFSNDILAYYGKLIPDIFASYCTESVFPFVNAALKLKYGIYQHSVVSHIPAMDGQSAGFRPEAFTRVTGKKSNEHGFLGTDILKIMRHPDAIKYGLGYEECDNVVMHDPSQYDNDGYCINDQLKVYIKDNLFLPKDILDYTKVKSEYV